jgi:hypothetical protein
MSVAKQQNSYQCDQCGSPNIVACRYSMSRAHGHIRAQLIGDRANHIQLKERHRRAARGTAAHFFCGASYCRSFCSGLGLLQRDAKVPKDCVIHGVPTRSLGTACPRLRHRTRANKSQSVPIQSSGLPRALLNVGAYIHVPPLRKATSYSFIIRAIAVEERFPVGPAKGDAAALLPQVFPTRMIRSRHQIVFEFGWCSFLFSLSRPSKHPGFFESAENYEMIRPDCSVNLCHTLERSRHGYLRCRSMSVLNSICSILR